MIEPSRMTGPEAGVLKYDLLTALSVAGLRGSPTLQTSLMRLMALITARYNWRLDELSVGQRDMARMWSVNERTVKREMKRLTEAGLLICKRSGVRGRVGAYRLNYRQIVSLSESSWHLVGPDFDERMRARYGEADVKVVQLNAHKKLPELVPDDPRPGTWDRAMAQLSVEQPHLYGAWFARLDFVDFSEGILSLTAPSKFIQRYLETHLMPVLIEAAEKQLGRVRQVVLTV